MGHAFLHERSKIKNKFKKMYCGNFQIDLASSTQRFVCFSHTFVVLRFNLLTVGALIADPDRESSSRMFGSQLL